MLSVEDMRSFATAGSNGHITGMGGLDEEISAMLQSSHTTLSQASLAGVMAPDIFTSHASPYPHPGGGLARTSSVGLPNSSRPRPHPNSRNNLRPQSNQPWAHMTGDEKWMLDAKGEVLDMFDSSGFGMMNPPAAAAAPPPPASGGLHRYHSAPSAFLQALADEAFSQLPPPPPPSSNMFSEAPLTPITEVMDVERSGSGNSVNEFEQFLSPDSDFSRRTAMSALQAKPDNAETFPSLFPAPKSTALLHQKSLPGAQQLKVPKQDPMEQEHSEESISGTSEDNSLVSGFIDTLTSWPSSPTTPGSAKRPRGGDTTTAAATPAWDQSEITSSSGGGLIRHMSLPTEGENLVQMRARAKRGCATHPRSIAERVRRTRISERMKKLQDLVPNMEKTSNTSDMLDETVEYVKSLQLKVAELQDTITQLKAQSTTLQTTST